MSVNNGSTASLARQCWICLSESRAAEDDWVAPCACKGSTRWVHQACLLAWLASTNPGMETSPGVRTPAIGETTPALQALQHAAFYMTDAPRCPQCHTPYRVVEDTVLPRPAMAVVQRMQRAAESAIVAASIAGAVTSVYVVASTYGLAVVCAMQGEGPAAVFAGTLATLRAASGWRGAVHAAAAVARVAFGLPLVPLYALSVGRPSLSVLYPLAPALAYAGPGSFDLRAWPPSTTAALLPFVTVLYGQARRSFFSRLLRRTRVSDSANGSVSAATPTISIASPDAEGSESQPASPTPSSPATSELIAAEEEEDRVIQRSILDTAASLVLPFAASAIGLLLFRRLPHWVPSALSRPMNRAVLGGLVLLLARDAVSTVAALQRRLSRSTRRVLDYKP